jgi:predicted DsbA family dithiol-disulfide isomerase
VDIDRVMDRLRSTAQGLGLPFGNRRMTYNSRPAQEVGKWADVQGFGEAFHRKAFQAYFVHGRNIHRTDVLEKIAASAGLDPSGVAAALGNDDFRNAVDKDWSRSRNMGITAVPTFAMDGEFLVGAQPYEAIEALVNRHGAARREGRS